MNNQRIMSAYVFFLSFLTLLASTNGKLASQSYDWKHLHRSPENYPMNSISISPSGLGIIMGGAFGTFRISTDGGINWTLKRYDFENEIHSVRWIDPTTILAVGEEGIVARFDQLGNLIESRKITNKTLLSISTDVNGIAIIVGEGSDIYHTNDRGGNWDITSLNFTKDSLISCYLNGVHAIAVGTSGLVFTSINSGLTWTKRNSPAKTTRLTECIGRISGEWIVGGDTSIFSRSMDDGETWTPIAIDTLLNGISFKIRDLKFLDPKRGILVVYDIYNTTAMLFESNDGGESWKIRYGIEPLTSSDLLSIREIDFPLGDTQGFHVGFPEIFGTIKVFMNQGHDFSRRTIESYHSPIFVETIAATDSTAYAITNQERIRGVNSSVSSFFELNLLTGQSRTLYLDSTKSNASIEYKSIHLVSNNVIIRADSIPFAHRDSTRSVLLVSKDFCKTWERKYIPMGIVTALATTTQNIILVTCNGSVFRSIDLGDSWKLSSLPSTIDRISIVSGKDGNSYLAGRRNKLWYFYKTNDGIAWDLSNILGQKNPNVFAPKNDGIVFGTENGFVNSTGILYRYRTPESYDTIVVGCRDPFSIGVMDMVYANNGALFCTAGRYYVSYSTDVGNSWEFVQFTKALRYAQERAPYSENLRHISVVGNYLVANSERSILYANLKEPLSVEQSIEESNLIKTNPPYPNPCLNKAKVLVKWFYGIDRSSVTSKLYNSFGEEIEDYTSQLTTNPVDQGALIDLDCSKLSSGIYYIKSQAGSESSTSSVVVTQ